MNRIESGILFFFLLIHCLCVQPGYVFGNPCADTTTTHSAKHGKTKSDISTAYAQSHRNEFSLWAGYAFDSFQLWGQTPDATIGSVGFRYSRKILHVNNLDLEYIFQISAYSKYSYPEYKPGRPRNSLSGFGLTPLGIQANFFASRAIQPFLNSSAGFMFLDEPFPDFRGKEFNYTLRVGTGVEFMISESVSLSVGLQYHHLSNGNRGKINPGLDTSMLYTAFSIF